MRYQLKNNQRAKLLDALGQQEVILIPYSKTGAYVLIGKEAEYSLERVIAILNKGNINIENHINPEMPFDFVGRIGLMSKELEKICVEIGATVLNVQEVSTAAQESIPRTRY